MICDRCGGSVGFLGAVYRFGESADEPIITEDVCMPCATKMERQVFNAFDYPELLAAMVLQMSDGLADLYAAFCRRRGISEFDEVLNA